MSNVIAGTDNDNNVIAANIEPASRAVTVSRALHNRIALSTQWNVSYLWGDVPAAGDRYILLRVTGAKNPHISITIMTEAKAYWWLYENPTTTNDGTALDEISVNRQNVTVPTMVVSRDATTTALGTLLETGMLGSSGKFLDIGGSAPTAGYWLLATAEAYLIRIDNMDDAAKDLAVNITWHED